MSVINRIELSGSFNREIAVAQARKGMVEYVRRLEETAMGDVVTMNAIKADVAQYSDSAYFALHQYSTTHNILLPIFDDTPLDERTFTVTTKHIRFTPIYLCLGIFVLGEEGIKYGAHVMQDCHSDVLEDYREDADKVVTTIQSFFPDIPKMITYTSLFLGDTLQHQAIFTAISAAFPKVEVKKMRDMRM